MRKYIILILAILFIISNNINAQETTSFNITNFQIFPQQPFIMLPYQPMIPPPINITTNTQSITQPENPSTVETQSTPLPENPSPTNTQPIILSENPQPQLNWIIQTVDTNVVGHNTDISLDQNENPHIVYAAYHNLVSKKIKYSFWNGSYWDIKTIINYPQGTNVNDVSFDLDNNDDPHIAYSIHYKESDYKTWTGYKYCKKTDNFWEFETVDTAPIDDPKNISLALDSNNLPHIAYCSKLPYSGLWDRCLKYAKKIGSSWDIQVADPASDSLIVRTAGYNPSIDVAPDGYPHISHHAWVGHDLKYAFQTGSSWNRKTFPENPGYTGMYNSLVIDNN